MFPERQSNRDPKLRKYWWLFRRSNEQVRSAITDIPRFIVTPGTSKHRLFSFLPAATKPEHRLVVIGTEDAFLLGVLSSGLHVLFSLAAGGTLEDRPVHNKTRCFDTFPFPDCPEGQKSRIRAIPGPHTPKFLAKQFTRASEADIAEILETLAALGRTASFN